MIAKPGTVITATSTVPNASQFTPTGEFVGWKFSIIVAGLNLVSNAVFSSCAEAKSAMREYVDTINESVDKENEW